MVDINYFKILLNILHCSKQSIIYSVVTGNNPAALRSGGMDVLLPMVVGVLF
jgi:hypothetical protein